MVCMHFCRLRSAHPHPELTLNGTLIPVVEQTKFLGVIFDNKLAFLPHIRYLKEKCVKALNRLRVVAHTFWGADQHTLLHLCLGVFRTSPASICVQANEPPLYIRRGMLRIQYSLRLGSSPSNPAYNTVFSPKFKASFS